MKEKKIIKKVIIGLVVAVLGLVLYSILVPTEGENRSSLTSLLDSSALGQIQESDISLANADILRVLGSIEDINLNDDILANPTFRLLKDSNFSISAPNRIGRPNPFLPAGFDEIAASQQTGFVGDPVTSSGSFGAVNDGSGFFNQDTTAQTDELVDGAL